LRAKIIDLRRNNSQGIKPSLIVNRKK